MTGIEDAPRKSRGLFRRSRAASTASTSEPGSGVRAIETAPMASAWDNPDEELWEEDAWPEPVPRRRGPRKTAEMFDRPPRTSPWDDESGWQTGEINASGSDVDAWLESDADEFADDSTGWAADDRATGTTKTRASNEPPTWTGYTPRHVKTSDAGYSERRTAPADESPAVVSTPAPGASWPEDDLFDESGPSLPAAAASAETLPDPVPAAAAIDELIPDEMIPDEFVEDQPFLDAIVADQAVSETVVTDDIGVDPAHPVPGPAVSIPAAPDPVGPDPVGPDPLVVAAGSWVPDTEEVFDTRPTIDPGEEETGYLGQYDGQTADLGYDETAIDDPFPDDGFVDEDRGFDPEPASAMADSRVSSSARGPTGDWVSLVTLTGLGLTAVAGLWQLLGIAQGAMMRLTDVRYDIGHRMGIALDRGAAIHAVALVLAVLLIWLPSSLGDRAARSYGDLAGSALGVCGASALITAIGALLGFREKLHTYSLLGSTPRAAVLSAAAELVAGAGIAMVAFAMALMSLRARR